VTSGDRLSYKNSKNIF